MAHEARRVVIMGAAGRDFHNFNVAFRDDPAFEVVAFTAAQIPGIAGRTYPPALAGGRYPDGIPILPEDDLARICREHRVDEVVFAYSDVEHAHVMHKASIAIAAGADFSLLGPRRTMIAAKVPVIAVCAVRTGAGKSQTTRWLSRLLKSHGLTTAAIRHPMPYGDLERQAVQRFVSIGDLDAAGCTIEEREEYEPHIAIGNIVYAGVDYARITARAEQEVDVILWDGGNNDFAFLRPDLQIVLVDPLRPGHETTHHPGEAVLRMADIVVIARPTRPPRPTSARSPTPRDRWRRGRRSCAPPPWSRSTMRPACARGRCWSSTTGRPSPMAAWPTAPAMSPRSVPAPARSSIRGSPRRATSSTYSAGSPISDRFCRRWAIRIASSRTSPAPSTNPKPRSSLPGPRAISAI
jgi:hypothetical protein